MNDFSFSTMSSTPSLKKNFAYKSILTVSTYIIGFVTFPYIARVLGVEKIGIVNFVDNVINYFLLFATMGISILGVREIASVSDDIEKRSKIFANLLGLSLVFSTVVIFILLLCISYIPQLHKYQLLLYVGVAKILFSTFLIEWFYTGMEDFHYVTIRSIIVKVIYVISIFCLIKDSNDYVLYFVLTTGTIILNAIINMVYVHRFINFRFKDLFSVQYVKVNLALGIYLILNSMYSTFNVIFLGFVSNNAQVGYYTTAFKLYSIVLAFFSAYTAVMLPRMNILLAKNDQNVFNKLIEKSFSVIYTFSIPLIIFGMILASDIISVLAGEGFEESVAPMIIIMPAILAVGISQILAVQIVTPLKKDKVLLFASIAGAASGLILNIFLVPIFKSIGTSITLLCSEMVVALIYIFYVLYNRIAQIHLPLLWKNILCCLPSSAICIFTTSYFDNPFLSIAISLLLGGIVWLLLAYNVPNSGLKLILNK